MDELISDKDVNDTQINYGVWKSERIQNRLRLQEIRKKILSIMAYRWFLLYSNSIDCN